MKARRRGCELCGGAAAVHCEADAAHLCWPCDARVHGANFLVARHVRRVACAGCGALGDDRLLVGAGSPAPIGAHLCGACAAASAAASDDESESGSCISSAESAAVASPGRRGEAAIRAAATARPRRRRGRRRRHAGGSWRARHGSDRAFRGSGWGRRQGQGGRMG